MVKKIGIKRLLAIIIILCILIIICVNVFKYVDSKRRHKADSEVVDDITEEGRQYIEENENKVKNIEDLGDYTIVKNALLKFYNNYSAMYTPDNDDNTFSKIVCDLLANDYKTKYDINSENVKDKLPEIEETDIIITNGYQVKDFEKKNVYYVEYLTKEKTATEYKNEKALIVCNTNENIFELYLGDYVSELELTNYNIDDEFSINLNVDFEKNDSNSYGASNYSYEDYAEEKLDDFRNIAMNNRELAYDLLDSDFKSSKYPSFNSFKSFIDTNIKDIFLMSYGSSETGNTDNGSVIKIYDKNDKFYIILHTNSLAKVSYEIEKYM